MNGLEVLDRDSYETQVQKGELQIWLNWFRTSQKAVLNTSANDRSFYVMQIKQTSEAKMFLYRGLTTVSLNENNYSTEEGLSNYDSDGNGVVVGAKQNIS